MSTEETTNEMAQEYEAARQIVIEHLSRDALSYVDVLESLEEDGEFDYEHLTTTASHVYDIVVELIAELQEYAIENF